MSRLRLVSRARPVSWVCLDAGYTVRWRRGDPVAVVFEGRQMGSSDSTAGAIDTIPVPLAGWLDLAEARRVAERWIKHRATSATASASRGREGPDVWSGSTVRG